MLGKPLLFFSSYAPLFGLLAIRFEQCLKPVDRPGKGCTFPVI